MVVTGPQKNTTVENPNSVTLKVDSENFKCYSVTATNDNFTVIVEEMVSVDMGKFGIFNERFSTVGHDHNSYVHVD